MQMDNVNVNANQNTVALYQGEAIQLPLDLFIPPDALEIWLDAFEGPFDLLLYLIKKKWSPLALIGLTLAVGIIGSYIPNLL